MPSFDDKRRTGTIFMGPSPDRETTLDRLYSVTRREVWNKRTEEEYLERVRARATDRVRALLLQARERGEEILREAGSRADDLRAEAEAVKAEAAAVRAEADRILDEARGVREEAAALREAAHGEGFEAGRNEALARLAEERRALAETTGVVLLGIHEQCGHIFEAWREDMAALLREAVEKATGWVADHERAAMLESLLEQSMRALLDRRRFTVRVNPVDAELLTGMLADAHKAGPRATDWELATDPNLEPGSLVVESESALVDNSLPARRSVVDEVLEHLSLPQGEADQAAFSAVADTLVTELRRHGVDLTEEGSPESPDPAEPDAAGPSAFPEKAAAPPLPPDADGLPPSSPHPDAAPSDVPEADPEPEDLQTASGEAVPETMEADPASPSPAAPAGDPPSPSVMADAEAENMVQEFLGDPAGTLAEAAASPAGEEAAGLPPEVADELLADMGIAPETGHGG